jgi:hypothetical protein
VRVTDVNGATTASSMTVTVRPPPSMDILDPLVATVGHPTVLRARLRGVRPLSVQVDSKGTRSPAKIKHVIFQAEGDESGSEGDWIIRIPSPLLVGQATWLFTILDGNNAVASFEQVFISRPKPELHDVPRSVTISVGHTFEFDVRFSGDISFSDLHFTCDSKVISIVNGVSLSNSSTGEGKASLLMRSHAEGKTTLVVTARDVRGASALPFNIDVKSVPGPLLGFASMAHLLATPGETREIDFAMSGYGKLSIKATADSDAVRASVKVWAGSNSGTLTVHFARTLGTARVRLSLTDANGAVVTEIVQCDTLAPKKKSRHQQWLASRAAPHT